jgi:hypothetical protein
VQKYVNEIQETMDKELNEFQEKAKTQLNESKRIPTNI